MKKLFLLLTAAGTSSILAGDPDAGTEHKGMGCCAQNAAALAHKGMSCCAQKASTAAPVTAAQPQDGVAADPKPKAKPYPLTTCLVSGEKLGEMGAPVVFTHEGQEIKLCCKSCKPKFAKDPAKYLKKLEPKK